jgi:spore maturation protein CgeB
VRGRDLGRFFSVGDEVTPRRTRGPKAKVAYYLAHEDERRELARRARARALREHTYEHRVRQVLHTVGLA